MDRTHFRKLTMDESKISKIGEIIAERMKGEFDQIRAWATEQKKNRELLLSKEHDLIGRILKSHLIVENYVTNYLSAKYPMLDIANARLSFHQKVTLLPYGETQVEWLRKGIFELNKIRNRYSHSLDAEITIDQVSEMEKIVHIYKPISGIKEPIEIIESFTNICCENIYATPEKFFVAYQEVLKVALEEAHQNNA